MNMNNIKFILKKRFLAYICKFPSRALYRIKDETQTILSLSSGAFYFNYSIRIVAEYSAQTFINITWHIKNIFQKLWKAIWHKH